MHIYMSICVYMYTCIDIVRTSPLISGSLRSHMGSESLADKAVGFHAGPQGLCNEGLSGAINIKQMGKFMPC